MKHVSGKTNVLIAGKQHDQNQYQQPMTPKKAASNAYCKHMYAYVSPAGQVGGAHHWIHDQVHSLTFTQSSRPQGPRST